MTRFLSLLWSNLRILVSVLKAFKPRTSAKSLSISSLCLETVSASSSFSRRTSVESSESKSVVGVESALFWSSTRASKRFWWSALRLSVWDLTSSNFCFRRSSWVKISRFLLFWPSCLVPSVSSLLSSSFIRDYLGSSGLPPTTALGAGRSEGPWLVFARRRFWKGAGPAQ